MGADICPPSYIAAAAVTSFENSDIAQEFLIDTLIGAGSSLKYFKLWGFNFCNKTNNKYWIRML